MIRIQKTAKTIKANGHAQPLLCNSVSVLFQHTAFSLVNCVVKGGKEKEGYYELTAEHTEENDVLMNALVKTFKLMSEQFPEEISYEGKG
ncbi:ribosomal-processing cysteine protease Prp [Pilibacter termitis]|uniref:ribosomal-processing cysteine protease Prp n=1 Tax=Pilibacter termitis TaxID=263852 RepID=UPI0013565591|nr:ribosomal-processing cysteine protease Prp [Pilibacter termitis]